MISDQILAGDAEIHRIPILEGVPQRLELLLSQTWALRCIEWFAQEDVVECFDAQLTGFNARWASLCALEHATLQLMGYSVVSLVNG